MLQSQNKTKSLRHYSFSPIKRRSSELTPFGAAKNQEVLRNLKVEQSPAGEHIIVDFETEIRRKSVQEKNFNKFRRLSVVLTDKTAKILTNSNLRRFSQPSQLDENNNSHQQPDHQMSIKNPTQKTELDQIKDESDESESISAHQSSKVSQHTKTKNINPTTVATRDSQGLYPFKWSKKISQRISENLIKRSSSFFEDDGLSHEIGSQESMNSEDRIKAQTILNRVLYIEGNLKEIYKFEEMIEGNKISDEIEDPYPDFQEGLFFITVRNYKAILCCRPNKQTLKIVINDARSFYIFNEKSRFRNFAVELTESNEFQTLTLLVILLTTVCLIIFDYQDRTSSQNFNQILNKINQYSTFYYIIECVLKMIAQGVFVHPNSYFRDGWNYLDFMVVLAGLTELTPLPNIPATGSRAFRVLRPLKSIRQFPRMRKLISGLINSIPALINALFFMAFVFLQFGIFGTEQFGGDYLQRCRFPNDVVDGVWQIDSSQQRLCSKDQYGYQCLSGTVCGEPSDMGLDYNLDYEMQISHYNFQDYGISNMKNPLWSISTIFQCIILEGWSFIMYNHTDAQYPLVPQIYFIVLIIVGAFFLFHIVLAIIEFSLASSDFNQDASDNQRKMEVAMSLKRRRNQLKADRLDEFQETLQKMADLRQTNEEAQKTKMIQRLWFTFSNKELKTVKPISNKNNDMQPVSSFQPKNREKIPNSSRKLILTEQAKELVEAPPFQDFPETNYQLTDVVNQDQCDSLITQQQNKNNEGQLVGKQIKQEDQLSKTVSEEILPQRALDNRLYYFFYKLCINPGFLFFWTLVIVANSICMTLDKYPEDQKFLEKLDLLNQCFSWLFTLEMIIKLVGFGIKEYLRDKFNIFDAIVVILCLADNIMTYTSGNSFSGGGILVLRSIRLLRVFKLARNWVSFRILMQKILDSFQSIFTFSILLVIFMIVFIILGMQFFAGTVYLNSHDQLVTKNEGGIPPLNNFENLYNATTTVFAIMILDNWNQMMYPYQRGQGYYGLFFFQITLIITNTILLNLFLALILELFDNPTKIDDSNDTELSGMDSVKRRLVRFIRVCLNQIPYVDRKFHLSQKLIAFENYLSQKYDSKKEVSASDSYELNNSDDDDMIEQHKLNQKNFQPKQFTQQLSLKRQTTSIAQIVEKETIQQKTKQKFLKVKRLHGNSLYIFAPNSILRQFCVYIYNQPYFESISNIFVLVSTILLALDNPLDDPNSFKQKTLGILDYIMTGVFCLEAIIKITVLGFLINGQKSYLKEYWNILDFFVVTVSILSYLPINANLQFYKSMRLLRILRPLRMIQRNQGLKIAVKSLINVLPEVFNLVVISLLTMGLFSVLGVNLYKGTFFSCNFSNVPSYQQESVQTMWDCLDNGGEWVNSDQNFDNFLNALLVIFQIMSDECWYLVFTRAQNSRNIFQSPAPQYSYKSFVFFVFILMVQAVFIFNLFIGAVISTFDNEKEKISHNTQLTELEREYIETCIKCYKISPRKQFQEKGQCLRRFLFVIVESKIFTTAIFVAIIFNSAVLSLTWYNQSVQISQILEYINKALIGVFVIEFLLKFCAMGFDYFDDNWNVVDFLIVLLGLLGYVLEFSVGQNYTLSMTVVRAFRVVRLIKLVRRLKELRRICMTFIEALPEILNIGSLLFLFLFIFVILGTNLFATVKLQYNLNEKVNFQSFGVAFVALFKTSTGEEWPLLMADLGRQRSIQYQCQYQQTYEDMQLNGIQGCGSSLSFPFFIAFQLFISFVMLNLFIAIILEGFKKELIQEQEKIQPETLDMFQMIWSKYDPKATGMVGLQEMEQIIMDLVQMEIHIQNQKPEKLRRITDEILFNFRNKKLLKLQTFWRQKFDDGSSDYQNLVQSVFFQKKLHRHFHSFIGNLSIPTYNGLKNFNFHDVLISFVDFSFGQRHRKEFFERKARIKQIVETKQALSQLDRIQLYSPEFYQLPRPERELLRELETEDFKSIIHFIELKGQRTDLVIQKIHQMKQLRRKQILKNSKTLDHFGDQVMTSQYVIAAQCINNFIRQQRERGRFMVATRSKRLDETADSKPNQQNFTKMNTLQKRKTIIGDKAFPIIPHVNPIQVENRQDGKQAGLLDFFNDILYDSEKVVNNKNNHFVVKQQPTKVDDIPEKLSQLLSDSLLSSKTSSQISHLPGKVEVKRFVNPLKLNFKNVDDNQGPSRFVTQIHHRNKLQNNFSTLTKGKFYNPTQVNQHKILQPDQPLASSDVVQRFSSSSSDQSVNVARPQIQTLDSTNKNFKKMGRNINDYFENSHRDMKKPDYASYTRTNKPHIKILRKRPRSQAELGRIKESTIMIYGKPKNIKVKMKRIERLTQFDLHEQILRNINSNPNRQKSTGIFGYLLSPKQKSLMKHKLTYRSNSPIRRSGQIQNLGHEENHILRKPPLQRTATPNVRKLQTKTKPTLRQYVNRQVETHKDRLRVQFADFEQALTESQKLQRQKTE